MLCIAAVECDAVLVVAVIGIVVATVVPVAPAAANVGSAFVVAASAKHSHSHTYKQINNHFLYILLVYVCVYSYYK